MPMFYVGLALAGLCLVSGVVFALVEKVALHGNEQSIEAEQVSFSAISKFPKLFWLSIFHMACSYTVFASLYTVSSGMSQKRFGLSLTTASLLLVSSFEVIVS
eukprot:TRINITY_DN2600_c0_g7_i1.p2 TRINITY_DN2600_c0_g7~~TRINITY_DN2600_c0_g7_i1.p2  ORF type:complete len:103 (+),score=17.15 TRINITY_DN2600_c0_g7_i1:908-1216(+)